MSRTTLIWILAGVLSVIAELVIFGLRWPWFGRTEEQKEMYRDSWPSKR